MKFLIVAITMLFDSKPGFGQQTPIIGMLTCDTIRLGGPGSGVAYHGLFRNSTYRFSAMIPAGLTGWGAGSTAPFHGFIIYLNREPSGSSCVNLQVGLHVELPEDDSSSVSQRYHAKAAKIGNRIGVRARRTGLVGGVSYQNVDVSLQLSHPGNKDDFFVTFITPSENMQQTAPVFEKFIAQLRFW